MPQEKKNFTYPITVKYVASAIDAEGMPCLKENEATVNVLYLQRNRVDHSKLALKIISAGRDLAAIGDIAVEFVKVAVDSPLKEDIAKDMFACINLYDRDEVQNDVIDFLQSLDFVRETPTAKTPDNESPNL